MKKTILTLVLAATCMLTKAQNCIAVNWSYFDNPSGDNIHWRLLVNWSSDGTKNLNTIVTNYGDTVLSECYQVNSGPGTLSGTLTYNFTIPSGNVNLVGKFRRFTGTCGNGTECSSEQTLINNVLPIKFEYITARNSGNNTLITFKAASVEGENQITVQYQMKDGSMKKHAISLPSEIKAGDIWMITINNITNTYTAKKL